MRMALNNERRARAAVEKELFMTEKELVMTAMRSISASPAAETASRANSMRLFAPEPVVVAADAVLEGIPAAAVEAARAAWADCCARHSIVWRAPQGVLNEVRDVHPTVEAAVRAAVPLRSLRVWHDVIAADAVPHAEIKPDFTVTDARDALPSTIGGLVLIEVKLPGLLSAAIEQVSAYLRRRVNALCEEADARGDALDGIFALGVATDGYHVSIVRVRSGAPRLGESFRGAQPCPTVATPALALLGAEWDFRQPPPLLRSCDPPDGFAALVRLFGAPARALGEGRPLASLTVALQRCNSGGAARAETLELRERLGSGGTSDAYACGGSDGDTVAKVARRLTLLQRARVALCLSRARCEHGYTQLLNAH